MRTEAEIMGRVNALCDEYAAGIGRALSPREWIEAHTALTIATALSWAVGMDEKEQAEHLKLRIEWVHRENPKILAEFFAS